VLIVWFMSKESGIELKRGILVASYVKNGMLLTLEIWWSGGQKDSS
jgi:hypothetical protein